MAAVATTLPACGSGGNPHALGAGGSKAQGSAPLPHSPVGDQLRWFLAAASHPPISASAARAHFSANFLAQVSPARLNATLSDLGILRPASVSSEGPNALAVTVSSSRGGQLEVEISVDGSGLIEGLRLLPLTTPAAPRTWAGVDAAVRSVEPRVHLLTAEVTDGSCRVIHSINPATPAPLGSTFKLYVLAALGRAVAAGRVDWAQPLTVTAAVKSLPSGDLQNEPDGTDISVRDVASKAISISDNTAADMLINLVGRPAVEAELTADGMAAPSRDEPFLTTREAFVLKLERWPALARQYASADQAGRRALLARTVDPAPLPTPAQAAAWVGPRDVDSVEWFASTVDLCHLYATLLDLSRQPADAELGLVLGTNDGGLALDGATWRTTWLKGGSETGVLTLAYLATTRDGRSYVTIVLTENPSAPIGVTATSTLLAATKGAFGLALG